MRERAFLAVSLLCVVIAELIGIHRRNGATISALTAQAFHVDTRTGRGVFAVLWVAFAAWYARHIWRFVVRASVKSGDEETP